MLEAFLYGLVSVFQWPAFGLMLLGIAIGFAVGILPGLGGAVTLALMLPFTFTMQPVEAFAFLLGMLSVTATTGDITSVLFGVPGEATTAATILDGYPMTKRGEAGRALGAALMSSLVGAVIGAFALAAVIPVVQPLVLSLGTPEFFMLAIVGITFVASLSSGAVRRGLIAGGLGLLLSFVGLDPQSGTQRFTFGLLYLWEGVSLIPVTIGLFAVPEIIELAVKGTSIAERRVGEIGGVLQGVKDTFRYWGVTVRCSLLGTFVGMIPGLGGSIAQWLAYAHAVQSSPDKSRFGQGDVRGVLGPGAANNSKEGGNLITTVAFGIPSTVVMAILLGAFLIQGLVPGPDMLTKNLHITFSLVWIIVVTNIITVGVCFLFLNQLVKITYVRAHLLVPFLILLIFIGAFTTNNTHLDLLVMLAFGALGYAMVTLGWPRPPLVLGLVLGKLAETYLYLSVGRYGWEWLFRPLVIVLLLIALAAVCYPTLAAWRGRKWDLSRLGGR
ncbi:MAG TPA: tripartite tricarboxylate transporter permease [Chloroflexota bacterium]|nr:tripartite tricarboxylate transporter permease [Chloroflexota bacterium]